MDQTETVDPIAERTKWISFATELLSLCAEILHTSVPNVEVTEKKFAEPKILALALLCRTYMNLKGVIAVAEQGLVVEARTLARSCFENMFLIAALEKKGAEFVTAMYDSHRKSARLRGEFVLEDLGDLDPLGEEMAEQLRARLHDIKELRPKAKILSPKGVAETSVVKPAYLFYSQLSDDAAHPSIVALKRHLIRLNENGSEVFGLDIHPVERGTEVADTVEMRWLATLRLVSASALAR